MASGQSRSMLAGKLCRCIKQVRRTVKARGTKKQTAKAKESAAIAICVRSVLGTRGRTLKRFRCKKGGPYVTTQAPLKK
jgi:hypothetical protein